MADDERIDALARKVAELSAKGGRRLRRVRVESGGDVVEVEWFAAEGTVHEAVEPSAAPVDDGLVAVEAPVVGTFYRSPQPGAPPYVEEGDAVEAGQAVGIVEAMKIMNQIAAPVAGRVAKVVVPDGEIVEFAQPLLWLDPS